VDGYPLVKFQERQWLVHRLAYRLLVGPLESGQQLHRCCATTGCVRPGCGHWEVSQPEIPRVMKSLPRGIRYEGTDKHGVDVMTMLLGNRPASGVPRPVEWTREDGILYLRSRPTRCSVCSQLLDVTVDNPATASLSAKRSARRHLLRSVQLNVPVGATAPEPESTDACAKQPEAERQQ
jgi:hypothetical protein